MRTNAMAKSPGAPAGARNPQKGPRRQAVGPDGRTQYVRFSTGLAAEIVRRVGLGQAWSQFCSTEGMPSYQTLYSWRRKKPDFAAALAIAKEEAAERKTTRALEVAEQAAEGVPGDRLRVTTLMQLAALEAPHVWGGKAVAAPAAKAEPVQIIFYARHFERAVGPDGKTFVREVKPEGEA
jgi:hypothetical protein